MICDSTVNFNTEKEVLNKELHEISAEKEAFLDLSNKLSDITASTIRDNRKFDTGQRKMFVNEQNRNNLDLIKNIFSETILELPHYNEAYDETLQEHMVEELGKDIVIAVKESSHFYPKLKKALIKSAISSANDRSRFIDKLTCELDCINEYERKLNKICGELRTIDKKCRKNDFNSLRYSHARLNEIYDQCEALSAKRQRQIQSRNSKFYLENDSQIETYLYSKCENNYPILATIAEIISAIQNKIKNIEDLISRLEVE